MACSTTQEAVEYNIPTSPDTTSLQNIKIYNIDEVDQKPSLKIGYQKLLLSIQYPLEARKVGAKGDVVVKFVVTPSGKGISPYIESSPHPSLSQESIRIIKNTALEPGIRNGEPVYSWFSLPIKYNLSSATPN
jgi:TonB family protein